MSKTFNKAMLAKKPSIAPVNTNSDCSVILDAELGIDGAQNAVFVDSSPSNRPVSAFGDVHQGSFSPFSEHWSAFFNGSGQYMQVSSTAADVQLGQVFTIELWFCLSGNLTYRTDVNSYMARLLSGAEMNMLELTISGTTTTPTIISLGRYGTGTGMIAATGLTIETGVWHHLALARNAAGVLSIFLDGVRVSTVTGSTVTVNGGTSYIGGVNVAGWHGYFPGYVSNLRVVKNTQIYDPTATTITVPTTKLTVVAGTTILALTDMFFSNKVNGQLSVRSGPVASVPLHPFAQTPRLGGSIHFDGNGDYLTVPDSSDLSMEGADFCIEAWVYLLPGSPRTNVEILHKGDAAVWSSGVEWGLTVGTDTRFGLNVIWSGETYQRLSGTTSAKQRQWCHVVASRKGSRISIFVNGVREYTMNTAGVIRRNNLPLYVGRSLDPVNGSQLAGYISNARIEKGNYVYDPDLPTLQLPTQPPIPTASTKLLLKGEYAGISDRRGLVNVRTRGNARARTDIKKLNLGSMFFDGAGDYLEVPYHDTLDLSRGDFTIQGWVRFSSFPTAGQAHTLFDKDSLSGTRYASYAFLVDSAGRLLAWTGNGAGLSPTGTTYQSTKVLTINEFHHFVFQRKANTISIYVDGVLELTSPVGVAPVNGAGPLTVGGNADRADRFMHGFIDKLEIIQGRALYTANFIPE